MCEAVTGGAAFAWKLLATLEGGSAMLAAAALLAYAARSRRSDSTRRHVRRVLVTNSNSSLAKEIITRLELRGCAVSTLTSEADETAIGGSGDIVDALVIVGAGIKMEGLEGMAGLVSEDVYCNLKLLESLCKRLRSGGYIVWACISNEENNNSLHTDNIYVNTMQAYDAVLQATLQHVAKEAHCEPIWIERCLSLHETAERTIAALVTDHATESQPGIAVRNAVKTISGYLTRWTKTATR